MEGRSRWLWKGGVGLWLWLCEPLLVSASWRLRAAEGREFRVTRDLGEFVYDIS